MVCLCGPLAYLPHPFQSPLWNAEMVLCGGNRALQLAETNGGGRDEMDGAHGIVMAAPPSTPQQSKRGERRERTRMRGLRSCARHDGNSKAWIKRSGHRFEDRRRDAGHAQEEIPDVKSSGTVRRRIGRSLVSLQGRPSSLLPGSGIRLQRKHNQNKHRFAPPLRRFLNYRVGLPGCAHAQQDAAPPPARKYVGKRLARRDDCRHQPIEEA
ncbi:mCG116398, partial [Mus musculus]